MKIITATGKEFQARWFGVSTLDGAFRACLIDTDVNTAFAVFTDQRETAVISLNRGELAPEEQLKGYTSFQGISTGSDGVTISLTRGE